MKKYTCLSLEILFTLLFLSAGTILSTAQDKKPRMKLGAYYFAGWGGKSSADDGKPENQWAKGMPSHATKKMLNEFAGRTPLWGWRDDKIEIMERQIDLAADHGLAFFSFCWYYLDDKGPININAIEGKSENKPMRLFMEAKNNKRMEFCLMIANHEGFDIVGTEPWKQGADYWIEIFRHPRYLKIEGKPLLIIYDPSRADPKALTYMQEAARKAGFPGVEVAACIEGKKEDGFTMVTRYNYVPGYGQPSERHSYAELADHFVNLWHGSSEQPIIPLMTAGWDRRPWEAPDGLGKGEVTSWYFDEGRSPEAFEDYLFKMAKWMEANPEQVTKEKLAVIYAWNEIGEGGWIIPCRDDPEGAYLKAVKNVVYSSEKEGIR